MTRSNVLPLLALSLVAAAFAVGCGSTSSASAVTPPVTSDPVVAILGPGMLPPLPTETWVDLPPAVTGADFPADLLPPAS